VKAPFSDAIRSADMSVTRANVCFQVKRASGFQAAMSADAHDSDFPKCRRSGPQSGGKQTKLALNRADEVGESMAVLPPQDNQLKRVTRGEPEPENRRNERK
jgi:hypothetical protein